MEYAAASEDFKLTKKEADAILGCISSDLVKDIATASPFIFENREYVLWVRKNYVRERIRAHLGKKYKNLYEIAEKLVRDEIQHSWNVFLLKSCLARPDDMFKDIADEVMETYKK